MSHRVGILAGGARPPGQTRGCLCPCHRGAWDVPCARGRRGAPGSMPTPRRAPPFPPLGLAQPPAAGAPVVRVSAGTWVRWLSAHVVC